MPIRIDRSADRPVRLYLIGDSHCLPYRDLLVHEQFTDRQYLAVTKYIPGFAAKDFSTGDGSKLSPAFEAALTGESLMRDGKLTLQSTEFQDLATGYASGTAAIPPIMMVFAGDIDLRAHFLPQLGETYDLVLPFSAHHPVVAGAQIMPYEIARRRVEDYLAPLLDGLSSIYARGLKRLFVHSLPPPTLDQAKFEALHGFRCAVETRYKATRLFNRVLSEFCPPRGIHFVDNWPQVTTNEGLLKPEFELDGVHLNREAACISLESTLDLAVTYTYHSVNPLRYELASQRAAPAAADPRRLAPDVAAAVSDFRKTGLCRFEVDRNTIDRIEKELDFSLDVGNRHARVDWYGNAVAAFSTQLRTAEPSQAVLDRVYSLLYQPRVEALVESCAGHSVYYVNCRPVMSLPHEDEGSGPQAWHVDGCPPGILRAILYLVDVDEGRGPFSYLSEDGAENAGDRASRDLGDLRREQAAAPSDAPEGAHSQGA